MSVFEKPIKNFYINEQQSIYLLSHQDAKKHRQWLNICKKQLSLLGYQSVELIGSGAFGFVFAGIDRYGEARVFKFSRITLPQTTRDRLEDEAYMLDQFDHPMIPRFFAFERIKKQGILMMARAEGEDLEQISLKQGRFPVKRLMALALQLQQVLLILRDHQQGGISRPIVHGDIKPSNLVWDEQKEHFSLIDWGSSVYAQLDEKGTPISSDIMDLMSDDIHRTNARMGDIYFIGDEQMSGAQSSPRFDEQGVASTLYALASAQSCRFAAQVLPATSLGLPQEFARVLDGMLSKEKVLRERAGDYFIHNMPKMANIYLADLPKTATQSFIPFQVDHLIVQPDTVVYSSRKQFLRDADQSQQLMDVDDEQLDRYYKEFLFETGDTEKAFLAAISRLAKYPIVGGLSFHWQQSGLSVESNLLLADESLSRPFTDAVNGLLMVAQGIMRKGLFKCCFFDARQTIQIERDQTGQLCFDQRPCLHYEKMAVTQREEHRPHSYFEDGKDPDEQLKLPDGVLHCMIELNQIHHTGCIIFESLPERLKIHYDYRLLDITQEVLFKHLLENMMQEVMQINGVGIAGFMKLPYKNARDFPLCERHQDRFYPKNPKSYLNYINT